MSGLFESWLVKLVSALQEREPYSNIIVVDWMFLAHQLYPDAVNNTKFVGSETARLMDWLQEKANLSLQHVHLIGYSLGAHVAGFSGNYVNGTIGRITGLDPAGPMFEGAEAHKRLSPDDADFVDVLHTYTREALVFHYQLKMHIFDYKNQDSSREPTFNVKLYGTVNDSTSLSLTVPEKIGYNFTNTFLVYTEENIGDLLSMKLTWEGTKQSWYSFWSSLQNYWSSSNNSDQELHVRRIRVKSGETQQKFTFCLNDLHASRITPGGELVFMKCKDGWEVKPRK
ncbi:hypothetical protein AB205_0146870, partial [Aquarana catesbeiana]